MADSKVVTGKVQDEPKQSCCVKNTLKKKKKDESMSGRILAAEGAGEEKTV